MSAAPKPPRTPLGKVIHAFLSEKPRCTRMRFAEMAGLKKGHLHNLMRDTPSPGLETLQKIARALDLTTSALVERIEAESRRSRRSQINRPSPSLS